MSSIKPSDPPPLARYQLTRRAGNTVYVSGITARTDTGCAGVSQSATGEKHYDIQAQTRYIFEKLERALQSESMGLNDVASLTCYLVDVNDFAEFNAAYSKFFTGSLPTRTCIAVSALPPPDARVEVTATAYKES